MATKQRRSDQKTRAWIEARKRHHLTEVQAQMARELGLDPARLGKLDNHRQQPWKAPLPAFIEQLYEDRFGKKRPDARDGPAGKAESQEVPGAPQGRR